MATAFVSMSGDTPVAVASDLAAAQAERLSVELSYSSSVEYDYRWDEYLPGQVWRLMQRRTGAAGKGRRFSWTASSVHAVALVEATR